MTYRLIYRTPLGREIADSAEFETLEGAEAYARDMESAGYRNIVIRRDD